MARYILTYTGKKFYPLDPNPADIDIHDIAHALSNTCRYTGHCNTFYSVAQHSLCVMNRVFAMPGPLPLELVMWGLMHDASEAYFADVATPVKEQLPDLIRIEDVLIRAVAKRFNLLMPIPEQVLIADKKELEHEMGYLFEDHTAYLAQIMQPREAERSFLDEFFTLQRRMSIETVH